MIAFLIIYLGLTLHVLVWGYQEQKNIPAAIIFALIWPYALAIAVVEATKQQSKK